jgi:hypothetical protein
LNSAGTGSGTYTFTNAVSCLNDVLNPTWSVDKFATIPAWLTIEWGSTTSTLSYNPTSANVGIITVRLTFTSATITQNVVTDTFFIEVYPYIAYGAPNNGSCATSVWPMHIGGSTVNLDFF